MNDRMDKKELLKLLKTLKIDKQEYWLLSSSALVLRGIYPDAGDLDIAVTNKGLEELKNNYNVVFKENGWFTISDKIEGTCVGEKEKMKYKPEIIGDYCVQNIKEYYEYLCNSDRPKDKARIPIVKQYIEQSKKIY